jgi:hypothetical protein
MTLRHGVVVVLCAGAALFAQDAPQPDLLRACCGDMRYRMIGPHRGGRGQAAAGIPAPPPPF